MTGAGSDRRPLGIGVTVVAALRRSGADAARLASAAEELGCSSLWAGENVVGPASLARSRYPQNADGRPHWTADECWPDAIVSLSFLASITRSVHVGTCVIAGNTRHPLLLAKQAATIDALSGGRLLLGLGAGWAVEQAEILGQAHDHPFGRLAETIDILRGSWGEPSLDHDGRFWSFAEVSLRPQPAQGGVLPIWIGGRGPRSIALAKEKGDGIILSARRIAEVARVRSELPATHPLGALVQLEGDLRADVAKARRAHDDGADLLVLQPAPEGDEVDQLERLISELSDLLHQPSPGDWLRART